MLRRGTLKMLRIAVAEGCNVSNSGQDWAGIVASRCKARIVVISEPGRRNAQRVVDTHRSGGLNVAAVPAGSDADAVYCRHDPGVLDRPVGQSAATDGAFPHLGGLRGFPDFDADFGNRAAGTDSAGGSAGAPVRSTDSGDIRVDRNGFGAADSCLDRAGYGC